jgi:hypothetical protein
MALMRHRDPKQTAETYTDARMLPLKEAIAKLNFHRSPGPSKDDTQNSVAAGQNGSFAVTPPLTSKSENSSLDMGLKSLFVPTSHTGAKEGKWSERQDLNLPPATDSQALTEADTQRDSQTPVASLHGLSQVVTAWAKLSEPLKAAILAIVKSAA